MKIRVYYNLYNKDDDSFQTLTTICNEHELPQILTWLQCSFYTEYLTLEILPEC